MTYIYSLGGGCYVYADIPKKMRSPSVLRGSISTNEKIFIPLMLFNGELKKYFCELEYWESKLDHCWLDKYTFDVNLSLKPIGITYSHSNQMKVNITDKSQIYGDAWFGFFDKFKYSQFFIIDFQRGGYEKFTNDQLLEFEKYLIDNKFDLDNFVYLDVKETMLVDRFKNCKIKSFIQSMYDNAGYGHSDTPNKFRNTYCFLNKNKRYVDDHIQKLMFK